MRNNLTNRSNQELLRTLGRSKLKSPSNEPSRRNARCDSVKSRLETADHLGAFVPLLLASALLGCGGAAGTPGHGGPGGPNRQPILGFPNHPPSHHQSRAAASP